MRKIPSPFILLFFTLIFSSCSSTRASYEPKVNLDQSPKTINKSVLIEKFINTSPFEDTEDPFSGISVTNEKTLSKKLELSSYLLK